MQENEKISFLTNINDWYRKLPDKKKYLEFMTALLSIPVLITVIISNVNNLKAKEVPLVTEPTKIVQYIPIKIPSEEKEKPTATPSPEIIPTTIECKKEVGPVDIGYPEEGAQISDNPVTVLVSYTPGEYCAVVWSYRINGGSWSQYDDKSISLYNMTSGQKKLELRVKSIASGKETDLTRLFYYTNDEVVATDSSGLSH